MSFELHGWIEIARQNGPEPGDHFWSGVVRLDPLVDVGDAVSERIFGLSKRFVESSSSREALAANRGVPTDASPEVRAALRAIDAHEHQFGTGEFGGYTHATWTELSAHPHLVTTHPDSDWTIVFTLAAQLAADMRLSGDRVRFVVWYAW